MGRPKWALLLILPILRGGSFFLIKILVAELPSFTLVLGRVGLAALVLNLVLLARRSPMPIDPRLWAGFALLGLLNKVGPFALIAFGEMRISSGLASILNATTLVFTVLAAHALTRSERLTWSKGLGVVFGILGVAILIGPNVLAGEGTSDIVGELACLYGRGFSGIAPLKRWFGESEQRG